MKHIGRTGVLAPLIASLAMGIAFAQTPQNQQPQQNLPQANQSQAGQNTGVSHPPPDDTIQATEINAQPEYNPPPPPAKPSPAIPAAQAATPAAVPAQPAPAVQSAQSQPSATVFPSSPETTPAPAAAADGEVDNTDYGIVTEVPALSQNSGATANGAQNPDYGIVTSVPQAAPATGVLNPDTGIVNYVPVDPNALGAGTNISVRLSQDLSTASAQRGDTFRAVVTQDVYNGSSLVIPAGSEMRGTVVYVSQGHHLGIRAAMRLRPDVILLPDRTAYHLYAAAIAARVPGVRVNDEGGIEAARHYKKDAIEYGAGTGVGAVAGAEIGGPVGAGVGSLVGAGLVTTHMLVQPPAALDLPRDSVVIFSLTQPMPLIPTNN